MGLKQNASLGIMGLSMFAAGIIGIVIHIWTIGIAYSTSGIFAALITFFFPFISEIIWFFKLGSALGYDTTYCVAMMAYFVFSVLAFIGSIFASSGD